MSQLMFVEDPLKNTFDTLFFDQKKYLFAGSRQGYIIIFEIRKCGEVIWKIWKFRKFWF